jgi:hypothetical protein
MCSMKGNEAVLTSDALKGVQSVLHGTKLIEN